MTIQDYDVILPEAIRSLSNTRVNDPAALKRPNRILRIGTRIQPRSATNHIRTVYRSQRSHTDLHHDALQSPEGMYA